MSTITAEVSLSGHSRVVPVDALREAARAYAEATSQRRAARDIGLSGTGFRAFLNGGLPQAGTLRKLREWYVRDLDLQEGEVSPDAAGAALSILVAHLPPAERDQAIRRVAELIAEMGRDRGLPSPGWLHIARQ